MGFCVGNWCQEVGSGVGFHRRWFWWVFVWGTGIRKLVLEGGELALELALEGGKIESGDGLLKLLKLLFKKSILL